MRQVWADDNWEFLKKIFLPARMANNAEGQSVKRSVGNDDQRTIAVEKISNWFDEDLS